MDEEAFDDMEDAMLETHLRSLSDSSKFQSIKWVHVFRKKIKKKKWIFAYTKKVRVIRFTVDEPQFVMESLIDNLSLEDFISPYEGERVILEIYDEHGNEVV